MCTIARRFRDVYIFTYVAYEFTRLLQKSVAYSADLMVSLHRTNSRHVHVVSENNTVDF